MKQCGNEIKLIVSDIDGTLLTSKNVLLPSTENAVRKIIDTKNCAFTLSTGRPFIFTNPMAEYLNLNVPYTFSSSAIHDLKEKRTVFTPLIKIDQIDKITVIAQKYNIGLLIHTEDGMFCLVDDKDWQTISSFEWMKGRQSDLPKRIEDIRAEIPKEIIRLDLFAEVSWLSKVRKEVHKKVIEVDAIKMTRSIEISEKGMDKGAALRRISKLLNIPLKNTMAIGDSLNDVSLLKSAGFGVAMETAPVDLKNVADEIVPSSDDRGLEKALQMVA